MGHNGSFDDFETLVKECDEFRLLLRESLLIILFRFFLNRIKLWTIDRNFIYLEIKNIHEYSHFCHVT